MDDVDSEPDSKSPKRSTGEVSGVDEDIISKLPDNILLYILSLLPVKDVLRTSALSTRWKHLWTGIPDIVFDEVYYNSWLPWKWEMSTNFLDLVERVLLRHDSSSIRRFHLTLQSKISSSRMNSWLSTAVSHKVGDINLRMPVETPFVLPDSLFTCESLTALKMNFLFVAPTVVHLPNLKILSLKGFTFPGDQFAQQLFSGCPFLEELSLDQCEWKNVKRVTISIPTLRKLVITGTDDNVEDVYDCVVTIYAENLLSIEFVSCLKIELLLCNLRSLNTAYIDESNCENGACVARTVKLFRGIYNVKYLTIPEFTLESLSAQTNLQACLPTYRNLTHLKVECGLEFPNSEAFLCLLQKSPNLESIEIPEILFRINYWFLNILPEYNPIPQCFNTSLKTVAISIGEKDDDVTFLRYVIEHAKMLGSAKLFCADPSAIEYLRQVISYMQNANRMGSPSCIIEYYLKGHLHPYC